MLKNCLLELPKLHFKDISRFKSETGSLSGTVEVTYVSLKSVYSIQDRWGPHHHDVCDHQITI